MNHEEEISRINKEFEKEKIKLVQEISRLNGIVSINENKLKHEREMFQEQTEKLEFELASMIKKNDSCRGENKRRYAESTEPGQAVPAGPIGEEHPCRAVTG